MAAVRVDTATVDFTPQPGLPLMGNFRDDYLARGVHDPSLYLGTVRSRAMGEFDWLSPSCEGAPEGGVNDG